MTPEAKVKNAVKRALEARGVYPFMKAADMHPLEVKGMYWMPVQGRFAVHGVHDFCGVYRGQFFSLETKAPNNPEDATEPQRAFAVAASHSLGWPRIGVRDTSVVDELLNAIDAFVETSLSEPI